MSLPGRANYEIYLYELPEQFIGGITSSTLRLFSTSALTARVEGSLYFFNGLELRVREFLDYRTHRIVDYSYAIYRGEKKIRWYDPQPHPEEQSLVETFPHHYHEEPGIKQHRLPAFGISFTDLNLPRLIEECLK